MRFIRVLLRVVLVLGLRLPSGIAGERVAHLHVETDCQVFTQPDVHDIPR